MARKRPLLGLELSVKKSVGKALKKAGNILVEKIRENASLTDHSLSDLKALGAPYSRNNPRDIHRPNFLVHRQSGDLLSAVGLNQVNQFLIQVGVDETKAPHVANVVFGTSKMVPRDFITGSFHQVEEDLLSIIIDGINEGIINGAA